MIFSFDILINNNDHNNKHNSILFIHYFYFSIISFVIVIRFFNYFKNFKNELKKLSPCFLKKVSSFILNNLKGVQKVILHIYRS